MTVEKPALHESKEIPNESYLKVSNYGKLSQQRKARLGRQNFPRKQRWRG